MALGMKNPSHWGPQEMFKEATKKTLVPTRTWDIKSGLTDRSLSIEQVGDTIVYTTQSHSPMRKDPYVTIHHKEDEKTAIAGVKLDSKSTWHVYLGDPTVESGAGGQDCVVTTGGNMRTRQYRFAPPAEQKDYAWRDTDEHEISIADTEIETSGRDRKFISLTPNGEEDGLLAIYVHNPKASLRNKAQIFWFTEISTEVELWALAAVMGLVERQRKSKDKFNFTAMVGAGAAM